MEKPDRIPFTVELEACKDPARELQAASKVLETSENINALKSAFTVVRQLAIFHGSLLESAPVVVENIITRTAKYISASDINLEISVYASKALSELVDNCPQTLQKHFESILKLLI